MKNTAIGLSLLVPFSVALGCVVVSEKPADSAPPPPPPVISPATPTDDAGTAAPTPTSTPEKKRPRLQSNRPMGAPPAADAGSSGAPVADAGLPDGFSLPLDASLDALPR